MNRKGRLKTDRIPSTAILCPAPRLNEETFWDWIPCWEHLNICIRGTDLITRDSDSTAVVQCVRKANQTVLTGSGIQKSHHVSYLLDI